MEAWESVRSLLPYLPLLGKIPIGMILAFRILVASYTVALFARLFPPSFPAWISAVFWIVIVLAWITTEVNLSLYRERRSPERLALIRDRSFLEKRLLAELLFAPRASVSLSADATALIDAKIIASKIAPDGKTHIWVADEFRDAVRAHLVELRLL